MSKQNGVLRHNINEFKSLNEVISFQKKYSTYRQQITSVTLRWLYSDGIAATA